MERGGWNLVFGWTNDAIANKNYSLLKEIFNLLITTPVSIPRLKSNRFPIVIKNFSKDCEDEETRTLCKHVVSRWISIAKSEEKGGEHIHIEHQQLPPVASQSQIHQQLVIPADLDAAAASTMNINTDHLLTIDPASVTAMLPSHEGVDGGVGNQTLMDLDFSHTDLANIDLTGTDFASFDILNKMVADGHNLEETISGGVIQHPQLHQQQEIIIHQQQHQIQPSSAPISVIQHAPPPQHQHQHQQQQLIHMVPHQQQIIYDPHQHLQQHQQVITHPQQQQVMVTQNAPTQNIIHLTSSNVNSHPQIQVLHQPQQQHMQQVTVPTSTPMTLVPVVQSQNQSPPKIYIKKVGGQTTVVKSFGGDATMTTGVAAPSVGGGGGQFCLMVKDGKNYLVRLKEQQNVMVTSAGNPVTSMVVQQQGPPPPVPDISSKVPPLVAQDNVDGAAGPVKKLKSPKREPQIVSPVNKVPTDIQKTYSKTSSSKDKDAKDKKSSDKDKDHHKDKKSSNHSSSSHKKSRSSSSSSGSSSSASKAAAAAQAKKDKEEEEKRLSEKIRKEKALMKKRQKEADKQKQQSDKDQETLKKLNLMPASSSGGKIPKIPRRSQPGSFADAIGIPGGSEEKADKIKKVNSDKKDKTSDMEQTPVPSSPPKKFYGKPEEEAKEDDKPKERRHKGKVYVSSKSRSDDLVKEMEGGGSTGKSSSSKEKDKKEKDDKEQNNKSSINLGNSIPATPPKISKRLSTDSLEKPGDAKKAKLEQEKQKEKIRKAQAAAITLKESSLFMDAISARAESNKSGKKKRRPSSGGDSKDVPPNPPKNLDDDVMTSEQQSEIPTTPEEDKKPVFNFYRDTLDDEDDDDSIVTAAAVERESGGGEAGVTIKMEEDPSEAGSFTPQENDGKVKSALVLIRPRNRPKKNVRWREEDELREFHFFEMDETERVNVTKQQKDFTELSCNEKLMERSFLKMRQDQDEEHGHLMQQKHQQQWKMMKIIFSTEVLTPPVISTEKGDQEEREKNVLGLFLPPGAILPDTGLEPDVQIPDEKSKEEPIQIPVEDVISITKVCDYRTHSWPDPKGSFALGMMMGGRGGVGYAGMPNRHFPPPPQQQNQMHQVQQPHHQFPGIPPLVVPNPILSPQQLQAPDYNPWSSNLGFSVPPPVGVPPPVTNPPDLVGGFASQFGNMNAATALTMNLGVPPPVAYPPNPFAFPPPAPAALMNGGVVPSGIMDYGTNSNNNSGGRGGNGSNSHHRGGGSRFDNNDRRGGSGRDRSTSRDRDYRDDRGRDSRDKDYRRGDRSGSDRDYRNDRDRQTGNDRNNRDFGRAASGSGRNSKSIKYSSQIILFVF